MIGQPEQAEPFYGQHETQLQLINDGSQFDFTKLKDIKNIAYDVLRKNDLSDDERDISICKSLQERIKLSYSINISIHKNPLALVTV